MPLGVKVVLGTSEIVLGGCKIALGGSRIALGGSKIALGRSKIALGGHTRKIALDDYKKGFAGCVQDLLRATTWMGHGKTRRRTCATLCSKATWKKESVPWRASNALDMET